MRHIRLVSQKPSAGVSLVPGGSPLEIKLNGVMAILDRVQLAQRQVGWKISFPGGVTGTTGTTGTTTIT